MSAVRFIKGLFRRLFPADRRGPWRGWWALCGLGIVVLSLQQGSGKPGAIPHADKAGHFIAYAVFAGLALKAFAGRRARAAALAGAVLLGAGMEWAQSRIPHRSSSWVDETANTMGVAAGAVAMTWRERRKCEEAA